MPGLVAALGGDRVNRIRFHEKQEANYNAQ